MLNEKAKAIYEFIKDSINSGFPPTVREICNALDIKSTSTVHKYINLLVSEGYLEKIEKAGIMYRFLLWETSLQVSLYLQLKILPSILILILIKITVTPCSH